MERTSRQDSLMGTVDWAKTMRRSAIDRFLPQPVVFHHIQKCGGTSVGRALRKRYILSQVSVRPEPSFRAHEAFVRAKGHAPDREQLLIDVLDLREQMLLYHMFDGVSAISAHIRFSETAHSIFAGRYKFMTVLRDPVKRFVSHYHWCRGKPGTHEEITEEFEPFLDTPRARRLGAAMVEYLCGLPKDVPTDAAEAISAASANLARFDIVGDIANTRQLQEDIQQVLGVRVSIGHENRRKGGGGTTQDLLADPAIRARVEEICAPDLAVYRQHQSARAAA